MYVEFSGVAVAYVYPEHMMGVVILNYLPWSLMAARNGVCKKVGSGSWFIGLLLRQGAAQLPETHLLLSGSSQDNFLQLATSSAAPAVPPFVRETLGFAL